MSWVSAAEARRHALRLIQLGQFPRSFRLARARRVRW